MSQMLRPADIATLVETALNAKAIELYDAETVVDKVVFNVTADFQVYERMQKAEYELDDYQKFTPIIISRINHYEYPADYLRYEESYSIGVYGYADQIEALETIIKAYVVEENTTNKSVVVSPFRITKEITDVSFGEDIEPNDGSLDKRIEGVGEFSWTFLDGIMTSYDTTIMIDGEVMPYTSFDFVGRTGTIQSETIDATGKTASEIGTNFYEMFITLPYISTSTVIKALYKEFYEGSYNKSHVLTYYDTALAETFTFNVSMKTRTFSDTQPKVLDFTISLVRAYPTVSLTIDAVAVPMLTFNMASGAMIDTDVQINSESAEGVYLGSSYTINMELDISDTTNTKTQELLTKVLAVDFATPHTLVFTKGAITQTYQVLLQSGTYAFSTNPIEKIGLTFIKLDESV